MSDTESNRQTSRKTPTQSHPDQVKNMNIQKYSKITDKITEIYADRLKIIENNGKIQTNTNTQGIIQTNKNATLSYSNTSNER